MAKPKESTLFEEPEFNEKEFLVMEKDRAKGVMLIFVLGALSGLFAGYLQLAGLWYMAVLLMLAVLILLSKLLAVFGIKVSEKTSHKVINYGVYILTWLLFWIIFINPPLHVVSSPQIQTFAVQPSGSTQWTNMTLNSNDIYQSPTGASHYSIHLTYRYDFKVTGFSFEQQGKNTYTNQPYTFSNGYLNFSVSGNIGTVGNIYDYKITWSSPATGNPNAVTFTLSYA